MKTRILSFLAAAAAFLTVLGGLDLTGVISFLPDQVAKVATTAFPSLAVIVHLVRTFGDALDDGQINGSFKCHPLAFVGAVGLGVLSLSSCAVTKAPDGTETRRYDAEAAAPWLQLVNDLFGPERGLSAETPIDPASSK